MNKQEFIGAIAQKSKISQKEAADIWNAAVETIIDALRSGEEVAIPGFGKFYVKETAEKNGINPRTKEPIVIPARKSGAFRAGTVLKNIED